MKHRADSPTEPIMKPQRSTIVIAVLGLVGVAIGAVTGMAYSVVVRNGDSAGLVSIASISVGALASIAGGAAVQHLRNNPENRD